MSETHTGGGGIDILDLQSLVSLNSGLGNVRLGIQQRLEQSQCPEFAFHGGAGSCITSG